MGLAFWLEELRKNFLGQMKQKLKVQLQVIAQTNKKLQLTLWNEFRVGQFFAKCTNSTKIKNEIVQNKKASESSYLF